MCRGHPRGRALVLDALRHVDDLDSRPRRVRQGMAHAAELDQLGVRDGRADAPAALGLANGSSVRWITSATAEAANACCDHPTPTTRRPGGRHRTDHHRDRTPRRRARAGAARRARMRATRSRRSAFMLRVAPQYPAMTILSTTRSGAL